MKPIEIHIEGYKIVISEEKQPEVLKEDEKISYIPYPIHPTTPQNPDVDKYPYATWTGGEMTVTNTIEDKHPAPIRDIMTGMVNNENA